jgi:hypothetical protein
MINANQSTLTAELIETYRTTDYVVFGESELHLKIGIQNEQLRALMAHHSCKAAAFITAYNPFGEQLNDAENCLTNQKLVSLLGTVGVTYFPREGRGVVGEWPPEPSFLILGIDQTASAKLGETLGQNAIVWSAAFAAPELVLLR